MFHNHHDLACLHCHPHTYIRMVQHLIEWCLLLGMSQADCVETLTHHASIQPLITLTVWKELHKENRGFFQSYLHAISQRPYNCRPFNRSSRFRRKRTWR